MPTKTSNHPEIDTEISALTKQADDLDEPSYVAYDFILIFTNK